jgi:hypothetical protein
MNSINLLLSDGASRFMSSNITAIKVKQTGIRKNVVQFYTGLDGSEFVGEVDLNRDTIDLLPEDDSR